MSNAVLPKLSRKHLLQGLLGITVAGALLSLCIFRTEPGELVRSLGSLTVAALIPALLCEAAVQLSKALKWQAVLSRVQPVRYTSTLAAVVVGAASTHLVPLRLDEVLRSAVLARREGLAPGTVLGTVPVEADGSAYMELPALRSFFFVALDENDLSVKRMQSFLTLQPGETTSCVGCHEQRTHTPRLEYDLLALRRAPSSVEPVPDVPDVFDFPRDVQPILDRHCVACHGSEATPQGGPLEGSIDLTGARGPMYSHSYFALTVNGQFSDGRNRPQSNYAPRTFGSSASPLMDKLGPEHYGVEVSDLERKIVRLWIEVGAPYPGTYAALGTGMIGGYERNQIQRPDLDWPETRAAQDVLDRRCASCHTDHLVLPRSPSDNRSMPPWDIRYGDIRLRLSRHILYDLTRPERSMLVRAPLAPEAGGYGRCRADFEDPGSALATVFDSRDDPDYRTLLAAVEAAARYLDEVKRFDMPGFQPRDAYLREMKRYGVLPADLEPSTPVDPYVTDRAYWRSLWFRPEER